MCEVAVFSKEISEFSKIHLPPSLFEEPVKFIAHGICSRDDCIIKKKHHNDKSGSGSSAENAFRPECVFHTKLLDQISLH